jgi:glutamate racemase
MGKKKLDAVLLGCTHYPLVEKYFRQALPKGVEIISQPEIVAKSLAAYLERHPEFKSKPPQTLKLLTTGDPNRLVHLEKFIPGRKIHFRSH